MNWPHQTLRVLRCALLALLLAGCRRAPPPAPSAPRAEPEPQRVTLLLNWFAEAEHGGFFAALAEGDFAAEGLAVEILPGGPGAAVIPRVATGGVDFGVENGDNIVLARAQDARVRALLAPIQVHPRCILVHAETGITNLVGLRDVTLAMNQGGAFAAFLKRHAPLENVRIVPFGGNVSLFLTGPRMAQQGYSFSEPFAARAAGADPKVLMLADLGFNPYTSCLIAGDRLLAERPDVARRMVRASRRGWERYLENPATAHARILAMNPEMSTALLEFGCAELRALVRDPAAPHAVAGGMTGARWAALCAQLTELALIPSGAVQPEDCYTTAFLP